jgi:hypothetical protein
MTLVGLAALTAGLLPFAVSFGQEKPKSEQYSALWAVLGGGSGGSFSVDIRIDRYSTDEDVKKFADVLAEGGPDRLRKAMEDEDVGQLSTSGGAGTPIAIARKMVDGNRTTIRIVTARSLSFVGLRSRRSASYPFTILELNLDRSGRGSGTAIAAGGISFDKVENTYAIKSSQQGKGYDKLLKVRMR